MWPFDVRFPADGVAVPLLLRRLQLDVAAFARGGRPCILGGARTFRGQGLPLGMPFFAFLLALTQE